MKLRLFSELFFDSLCLFKDPRLKVLQSQPATQTMEDKYRELVKQIEQYENKIDNFTGSLFVEYFGFEKLF